MKVAFFTEMNFIGKIPRNHTNMRTEFAWMVALDADHYNINQVPEDKYDLGIIIIPKKNPDIDLAQIKEYCNKVAVMQEGPHWYFQDYDIARQVHYYNSLQKADIIFAHNKKDKEYYQGLTQHKDIRVMQSLMIEDSIDVNSLTDSKDRKNCIIGGNFVSWYGGFDSFIVANNVFKSDEIYAPSMGRKQEGEENLIKHIPYTEWNDWIKQLSKFRVGIHLMRTHAAGTFALNCAYLGIPCIGYKGLDTQETLHPSLSIDVGDINKANELLKTLNDNKDFYDKCKEEAKKNYDKFYHERNFKID
tara:strand:+ start:528 stop:1436 length:909 start_codon:yes stop_codon:yes gene_type:complete